MTCTEARDLLQLLSFGALDVDERDELEHHLARCPECGAEHSAYLDTAARLALAFPQVDPSAGLKRRVLGAATSGRAVEPAGKPWWSRIQLGFLRPQPASLVAALALVVALGTTLWAAGLQMQLNEQRAVAASLRDRATRFDKVVAVLQAQQFELRQMAGTQAAPYASGRVYVDDDNGSGMLMVRKLPPLPQGRVYQLWWISPDGKRESGGTMTWTDPQGNGYTLIQCPGKLAQWQSFSITEEPAGGSLAPTGQRLLGGTI